MTSPTPASLTIRYVGPPITVDASKLPEQTEGDWLAPATYYIDRHGKDRFGDDYPGARAATLFDRAIDEGVLVLPDGIIAECYSDDDEAGSGFVIVAYQHDHRRGVTSGWRDVENIATPEGRDQDDREVVLAALRFFAAELNAGLGAKPDHLSAEQVAELEPYRGVFTDGYTPEDIDLLFADLGGLFGLALVCVWEYEDDLGCGGHSQLYANVDGCARYLPEGLEPFLNGEDTTSIGTTPLVAPLRDAPRLERLVRVSEHNYTYDDRRTDG